MVTQCQGERKCDTPNCPWTAARLVALGPGTSVWLCTTCAYLVDKSVEPKEDA